MRKRATAAVHSTDSIQPRHLHKRPQTLIGVMLGGVNAKLGVFTPDHVFSGHETGQGPQASCGGRANEH